MCTDVTHKDFITVHHEMAHIQFFLNYRNNPKVFRDGANPGNAFFLFSFSLIAICFAAFGKKVISAKNKRVC